MKNTIYVTRVYFMRKQIIQLVFPIFLFFSLFETTVAKTVIFFDKNFPTIENGAISRTSLEYAFASLNPSFVNLSDLQKNGSLAEGDLLILPYGSAFPADAWETIRRHLDQGNLLVLGGRALFVPVYHDSSGWRVEQPQNTFSKFIGIEHSYVAPQHGPWKLQWHEDAVWFQGGDLNPRQVFVNAGRDWRYHGLGYLVNERGDRLVAPITCTDLIGSTLPTQRNVFLCFDSESSYWDSKSGNELMRQAAVYASRGGVRIWFDLEQLTLNRGDRVSGAVDVMRNGESVKLTLELLSGETVLASSMTICGDLFREEINLKYALNNPGIYKVRATLSSGDTLLDRYTAGVVVRDTALLHSGERLEAGRDYFRLGGKPYLMVGANYFSNDLYTSAFFVGSSIGGNAWIWERDFAEMERQGITAVRTGIWQNRARYLDVVTGAADERILRAIEAYLHAAARHHMQVIFTFFAFDPQTELQQGNGQEGNRLGPGSNPYIDPVAIAAQAAYVRTIASRFRNVPFVSWDLINEPSFNNPKRPWKGNSPNGDPKETASWQRWLEQRYDSITNLANAWNVPPTELGGFNRVQLPSYADLELQRTGNSRLIRAVDYNLFAQDAFRSWTDSIIHAIRTTGSQQVVTVGQDEGGVADRVLNQFWAESKVNYTVNHTWWRDDALLWNSIVAKSIYKPNLIGETGPQPVLSMDGSWRWDDIQGLGLAERKLALGFANANAGVLHWDWSRDDLFSLLRRDGSYKQWMEAIRGIASFAREAQPYATESVHPDIALVLPQSLQLSVFGSWGVTAQQNSVRSLYNYARGTACIIGEFQLARIPKVKLIIVPSPWVLSQQAWDQLMSKVKAGATLLISGRIDADEHWKTVPQRLRDWNVKYSSASLITRDVLVKWSGGSSQLSYSGEKTTYAERGVLNNSQTFLDFSLGKGRILYSPFPLEMSDQLDEVGRVYKFAMKRAGVNSVYETSCEDPGILICPTQLPDATLYVFTSESAGTEPIEFKDKMSGKNFRINLAPGRAALLLIRENGSVVTSYNYKVQ
jgi:hypothetical protein